MARRVVLETYYTFTPSTKTLVIPRVIPQERMILITNITRNTVIYNFSDPNLTATSYVVSAPSGTFPASTTLTFAYNTAAVMQATDKISILIDESVEYFKPTEELMDPNSKLRVTEPQAMIDTDFEYGIQPSKWEQVLLVNNRPNNYFSLTAPLQGITDIRVNPNPASATAAQGVPGAFLSTGMRQVVVYLAAGAPTPATGSLIQVQGTAWQPADGSYVVDWTYSTAGGSAFAYTAKRSNFNSQIGGTSANLAIYNPTTTLVFNGNTYTGASLSGVPGYSTYALTNNQAVANVSPWVAPGLNGFSPPSVANLFTVNIGNAQITSTSVAGSLPGGHGLSIGNYVQILGMNANQYGNTSVQGNVAGTWQVQTISNAYSFSFSTVTTNVAAWGTTTAFQGNMLARQEGIYSHRPYDGGVQYNTNSPFHNLQAIRQTRRNFRYQAGKAIVMSCSTVFRPPYTIDNLANLTPTGTLVQVTTKFAHNLQTGANITLSGSTNTGYNFSSNISYIIDEYNFVTNAPAAPGLWSGTNNLPILSVNNWYNGYERIGLFDSQNGMFFEYTGQVLNVVRRDSTFQLAGNVNLTNGNAWVLGNNTQFAYQVNPGDFIVMRGMTYRVNHIYNNTAMTVLPEWRGPTLQGPQSGVVVSKVRELRIPQSQWNIDHCDGTGPSGYNIDLTRIQMLYLDYSWYGAGFIRFGFKDVQGQIFYVHRIVNNNQNFLSFTRSGNLPGRYETSTFALTAKLNANALSTDTQIVADNILGWPQAGTVWVADPTSYEFFNYTGITGNTFTGVTRGNGVVATYTNAITTQGSPYVFINNQTVNIQPGMFIQCAGFPENTFVANVVPGANANILLSYACNVSATTASLTQYPMASAAAAHTITPTAPIGMYLHAPNYSPLLTHWGTSVIMDGKFDPDKNYAFSANTTLTSVNPGTSQAMMSVRVSPSTDNGIGGALGVREILNRMQINMYQTDVLANGLFLIKLILNGTVSNGTWQSAGGSSLSQVCYHPFGANVVGGEQVFEFFFNPTGNAYAVTQQDLSQVRDLGTALLGGAPLGYLNGAFVAGANVQFANVNVFPDGPDMITVVAQNLQNSLPPFTNGGVANVACRISWFEAQA